MNEIENEIISKAGFLLYVDYWDKYFCKMTGEQIKETMQIIFHFNKTCEILKTNDLAIDMVVSTIIDNIKRDASKRIKQSKASRENGAMGGRPPKDKKPSKNPLKPKKTQSDLEIIELVEGLQFILEAKLNKKINTNSWKEPIRLLVEKDLAQRPNPIEDVNRAIQEVGNRFGEQYFPVIQSGGALREKFSKIENAMRKPQTKGESTIANIMEDF
jgi:hypothetical protein